MATHVFRSFSPHIGKPCAQRIELPTMKFVTSLRISEPASAS